MKVYATNPRGGTPSPEPIALKCPYCNHFGTFEITEVHDYVPESKYRLGFRKCPNRNCKGVVIIIVANDNRLVEIYPYYPLQFDKTGLPESIVKSLEEASKCFATMCYSASAVMIRKSMEQLCDEHSAKGDNLKDRIKSLRTIVVLPEALLDGVDNLRLLGNDAVHVTAKVYEDIGKEEIYIAFEVACEILKAIYQYKDLISKLEKLKKSPE